MNGIVSAGRFIILVGFLVLFIRVVGYVMFTRVIYQGGDTRRAFCGP